MILCVQKFLGILDFKRIQHFYATIHKNSLIHPTTLVWISRNNLLTRDTIEVVVHFWVPLLPKLPKFFLDLDVFLHYSKYDLSISRIWLRIDIFRYLCRRGTHLGGSRLYVIIRPMFLIPTPYDYIIKITMDALNIW